MIDCKDLERVASLIASPDTYYKKSQKERESDYLKLMPHLSVFSKGAEEIDIRKELAKQLLLLSGYKTKEIDAMNYSEMSDEEIQHHVRERLLGTLANNGNNQKVIPIAQVKEFVGQGWEYVAPLPQGEAVVKLPHKG